MEVRCLENKAKKMAATWIRLSTSMCLAQTCWNGLIQAGVFMNNIF